MKKFGSDFQQSDREIYDREIKNFLPDKILDAHVHIWLEKHINNFPEKTNNPFIDFKNFPEFSIEDFEIIKEKLFKNKKYTGIFFGNPFRNLNLEKMNSYIFNLTKKDNYFLYIPSPVDDLSNEFFSKISSYSGFIGFKPYPKLADKKQNEEVKITDFLNTNVLEYADSNEMLILLHLPRKRRLADKNNIFELKEITKKYKKIKLILAHSGRSYCLCDIENAIEEIKDIKNLYFELSFIHDWEIVQLILNKIDNKKIIYGSDMPVSTLKGKNVCINNEHYFVTKEPFEWSIGSQFLNLGFTYFLYEQIRALKKAFYNLGIKKDSHIEDIFFNNINNII